MIPQTIDINTGADVFRDADPIGIKTDTSVARYVEQLRRRVGELFPKARVFVRWSPAQSNGTDVYTIPRAAEVEAQISRVADELRAEADAWLRYDQQVRSAFQV